MTFKRGFTPRTKKAPENRSGLNLYWIKAAYVGKERRGARDRRTGY